MFILLDAYYIRWTALWFDFSVNSYPKGLIVAFTLKSKSTSNSAVNGCGSGPASESVDVPKADVNPGSVKAETEQTDEKTENVKVKEESTGENILIKSEEMVEVEPTLESDQAEQGKESLDIPVQKEEAKAGTEGNSAATMYKDNKDVVLREDLKKVFQKFGFVKVRLCDLSSFLRGTNMEFFLFIILLLSEILKFCCINNKVNGLVWRTVIYSQLNCSVTSN